MADSKVAKLKKDFTEQLNQVSRQIDANRAQLEQLETMREQLKGAIFALNAVEPSEQASEPKVEAVTEEKKEG